VKYRKKPVVIDAVQITPGNDEAVLAFMGETNCPFEVVGHWEMVIHTLEGDMHLSTDDWLIRGVQGEFYPCKPDIFEASYEAVEEEDALPRVRQEPNLREGVQ
jgi:hypothetical protein